MLEGEGSWNGSPAVKNPVKTAPGSLLSNNFALVSRIFSVSSFIFSRVLFTSFDKFNCSRLLKVSTFGLLVTFPNL